jgi:SAM-dependent methyltransferase
VNADQLTVAAPSEAVAQQRALGLRLLEQVRIRAWDRVLFVECGDGWLVEEAWRRLGRAYVCGLSTSPELAELAVRLRGAPGKVEFKTWDGQRFPLTDQSFDRVISCVPCSWYRDPVAVLREMARALEPDGDAYLPESDGAGPEVPPAVYTADLRRLLVEAGFSEVRRTRSLSSQGDAPPLVVIHVRPYAPKARRS